MKKFWILVTVVGILYCGIKSEESMEVKERKAEFTGCEDVTILEDGSVVLSSNGFHPATNGVGGGAVISIQVIEEKQEYSE